METYDEKRKEYIDSAFELLARWCEERGLLMERKKPNDFWAWVKRGKK